MKLGEQFVDYQETVFGRTVFAVPEVGFMVYEIQERGVYISDVYVEPGSRRGGYAKAMLEHVEGIARLAGKKYIFGTVDCTTKTWRESVAAQEAAGFKCAVQNGTAMLLVKEVPHVNAA